MSGGAGQVGSGRDDGIDETLGGGTKRISDARRRRQLHRVTPHRFTLLRLRPFLVSFAGKKLGRGLRIIIIIIIVRNIFVTIVR